VIEARKALGTAKIWRVVRIEFDEACRCERECKRWLPVAAMRYLPWKLPYASLVVNDAADKLLGKGSCPLVSYPVISEVSKAFSNLP
jgi:hypothetical protein